MVERSPKMLAREEKATTTTSTGQKTYIWPEPVVGLLLWTANEPNRRQQGALR